MKLYIQGYRTATDEEREAMRRDHPFEVINWLASYSETPEWTMEHYAAEMHLATLRTLGIHVGVHYCDFSIEELESGQIAIVCMQHPDKLPSLRITPPPEARLHHRMK